MKILLVGLLLFVTACGQQEEKGSEVKYQQVNWTYNSNFTSSEQSKIQSAMNVLASRIDQGKIWDCAYNNYKKWYTWGVPGMNNTTDFENFIYRTERAFSNGVPRIYLSSYYENSSSFGRASVDNYVEPKFVNTTSLVAIYRMQGTFNISLNRYNLSNADWATADTWAGVIFHELLHQMGHSHPNGYKDGNYITVAGDCLQENGSFSSRSSLTLAGGRRWAIPD